jgi:hypothetical protein
LIDQQINRDAVGEAALVLYPGLCPFPRLLICLTIAGTKETLKSFLWNIYCCHKSDVLDARFESLRDFGWLK